MEIPLLLKLQLSLERCTDESRVWRALCVFTQKADPVY